MPRDINPDVFTNAVATSCATLTAVKRVDFGQWQIPAVDDIQDQLSAIVIQYRGSSNGFKVAGGDLCYNHNILLTYLRYLNTLSETAGAVLSEARLCFNLFIQGRCPLPGWVQNTDGIEIKYCYPTAMEHKDGFLLDNAPIELVEIPLLIQASHFDPVLP